MVTQVSKTTNHFYQHLVSHRVNKHLIINKSPRFKIKCNPIELYKLLNKKMNLTNKIFNQLRVLSHFLVVASINLSHRSKLSIKTKN